MAEKNRAEAMNKKLTIKIKYRTYREWLLWLLVVMPFSFGFLNEFLGLPWAIRYVLDAAWCILLLERILVNRKRLTSLGAWIWLFLIYTFLIYLIQFQSPLYYLWGVRNNFRFYVAFFAFAAYLKPRDAIDYWKLFEKLFWLNIAVCVYQFAALGMRGDYLGGLFGAQRGSNAYTNIFFSIIVAKSLVFYLQKQEKLGICLAKCFTALVVAAMAELKFFYIEFLLLVILAVLITDFAQRKFVVIAVGVLGAILCVALLISLFPRFGGWFYLENILESAMSNKGYTSTGDLNRLNAIGRIQELWLDHIWTRIFGLGLGNCDTASFAFLNTPFFEANGDMHYTWISYAMMYLETGWIGLAFYWGFFVLVYAKLHAMEKHSDGLHRSYCMISKMIAIMCVLISIYNASLRAEAGYMAYFVLAIPFACREKREQKWTRKKES